MNRLPIEEDDDLIGTEEDSQSSWWMGVGSANTKGTSMTGQRVAEVRSKDSKPIKTEDDLLIVRAMVKRVAALLGFSLVNQTKIVTAASEIARNTLDYGGGGSVTVEVLDSGSAQGMRVLFEDEGPGINDIDLAMRDGFTTGHGMGLGLGGSKRLTDEFQVESIVGKGTRVSLTKWG